MYQEFKRKLLDEMEMRRDVIVLQASKSSYDPIFEVSSDNDKLYHNILTVFDMLAVKHVEALLCDLCLKHGIEAKLADYPEKFDLQMLINGQECYVELKTSPRVFSSTSLHAFAAKVEECDKPVFLVYLIKDGQNNRNAIARQEHFIRKHVVSGNLRVCIFEEFFLERFGVEELSLFKKAMSTYKEEMHQAVGYQITEIFNPHNLGLLKKELDKEIPGFPYDRVKNELYSELHSKDSRFQDLNMANYVNIKNIFLHDRYKLLLGESDFANSFLTSEWLYKKYFPLQDMDNTFMVAGYLKSIEQLLWDIIYIIGQGREVRGVTLEDDNLGDIDTTLGSLQHFITNYANDDLIENAFGSSTHFVMRYLGKQISEWRSNNRNGYFHKHNLFDKEKIGVIRDQTFFLYLLLLGTITLDQNAIAMLS